MELDTSIISFFDVVIRPQKIKVKISTTYSIESLSELLKTAAPKIIESIHDKKLQIILISISINKEAPQQILPMHFFQTTRNTYFWENV